MADGDLKSHALNGNHDFYDLLGIQEGASESEIRRAYRQTALKYHPDKVGANEEALDKFHLLQIAYDVLSDATVKELYNNARRARQAKAERDKAYEGRRKWMKEDLERRESGVFKRKREENEAEEQFERELRHLAEDGRRRRKAREELLRREAQELNQQDEVKNDSPPAPQGSGEVPDIDRSITFRYPQNDFNGHITKDVLISRFERFGKIDEVVLRDKKIKIEGEKHRKPYVTAVIVFRSIVGAHAAVSDFQKAKMEDPNELDTFEAVDWAAGKEPDCIPRPPTPATPATPLSKPRPKFKMPTGDAAPPTTPLQNGNDAGLKKVPSFGSFKGTPRGTPGAVNSPSLDEITMIRLKNAEKRRLEEKIKREEAAVAEAESNDASLD